MSGGARACKLPPFAAAAAAEPLSLPSTPAPSHLPPPSFAVFLHHLPDLHSQHPPDVLLRAVQAAIATISRCAGWVVCEGLRGFLRWV